MEFKAIVFCCLLSIVTEVVGEETTECTPKSCEKVDNEKAVCGSDGLSYPNRCLLERVRCVNKNITLVKRGLCKTQRSCLEWETLSLDFPEYRFKAKCKVNGTYEPVQCHPETNFCWCVAPDGIPIPYTTKRKNETTLLKQIKCKAKKKMIRSPSRKTKNHGLCSVTHKALFNRNLMQTFNTTYMAETKRNGTEEVIVRWKFNALDTNHDGYLDKTEYRDLKKFIRKYVKPRKCARSFPRPCDVDIDTRITFEEWKGCLSKDGVSDVKANNNRPTEEDAEEDDLIETPSNTQTPISPGVLSSESNVLSTSNLQEEDSAEAGEELSTCLSDRKLALEANDNLFAPECTPDGRFAQVQCYYSVNYCWCANEDTGNWIPGTAMQFVLPNCTALRVPPQPMRGCPDEKRLLFLNDLTQYFSDKINLTNTPSSPANSMALVQTKAEKVAHWIFNHLDKNKNKMLEKVEARAFKELIVPMKTLKKCGKRIPGYCDLNKDREISITEWLSCFNVQEHSVGSLPPNIQSLSSSTLSKTSSPSSRAGKKNPLLMLKED